jgi:hypothetical protein
MILMTPGRLHPACRPASLRHRRVRRTREPQGLPDPEQAPDGDASHRPRQHGLHGAQLSVRKRKARLFLTKFIFVAVLEPTFNDDSSV